MPLEDNDYAQNTEAESSDKLDIGMQLIACFSLTRADSITC